jgi:hypothetical protein
MRSTVSSSIAGVGLFACLQRRQVWHVRGQLLARSRARRNPGVFWLTLRAPGRSAGVLRLPEQVCGRVGKRCNTCAEMACALQQMQVASCTAGAGALTFEVLASTHRKVGTDRISQHVLEY